MRFRIEANNMNRIIWLLAVSFPLIDSARILVFICQVARSHHIVFHPIIKALAERGHEVDYYTHYPIANPPSTLNQIVFPAFEKAMKTMDDIDLEAFQSLPLIVSNWYVRNLKLAMEEDACYKSDEVKQLLGSNIKYDLVVGEFLFFQEQYAVLMHKFNATGITLSSLPDSSWVNELSGLPDNPAYMSHFLADFSDKINFLGRLRNFCNELLTKVTNYFFMVTYYQWLADEWLTYDGWQERPSILDLLSDMALILTSSHHSLGYSFPRSPIVKEVMGTNIEQTPPPLPKDLLDFMDSAEHGVVYFSMGSILSTKNLRLAGAYDPLVNVLSRLKQRVLWKWTSWSDEEMPSLPNIKMSKWLPQQSLLAHNKTKLFITHGGLGGLSEAIYNRVPLISIPVFGDQFRNSKIISSSGCGIELLFNNLTDTSVSWAVDELLNNQSYKEQARKRSLMFKDRQMKPVDEAVFWIEYVIRHGKILQPASLKLPIYQLYMLDIVSFIIVIILLLIYVAKKTIKFTIRKEHSYRQEEPSKYLSKKTE